jgi:hypothetical protein
MHAYLYNSNCPFEHPTATICALAPIEAQVAPLLGEHTQWLKARSCRKDKPEKNTRM